MITNIFWFTSAQMAEAATIQSVTGLPNGAVQIDYTNGQSVTQQVFSQSTSQITLAKKMNKEFVVVAQSNGRKIALLLVDQPNRIQTKRRTLVNDVRYRTANLNVGTFNNEKVAVLVAKKGKIVDTILTINENDAPVPVTIERVKNKSIVPKRTKVNSTTNRIQLRNKNGTTVKAYSVIGDEDPELLLQHDPVACDDGWYETHAHMEDIEAFPAYIKRLNQNGIACSLLFVGIAFEDAANEYKTEVALTQTNPGRLIPFYHGDPDALSFITTDNLQSILDIDDANILRGIGEFAFYQNILFGTSLENEPWPSIFAWAAENNLIIMIHLNNDQGAELNTMLTNYPNTKVLIHGQELVDELVELLTEHPNLYYTLDTANMIQVNSMPVMFPVQAGSGDDTVSDSQRANEFVATYDANKTTMLENAVSKYSDAITAAPNQILWGTDIAFTWHVREPVYNRLIEFSQEFAANFNEEFQTNYFRTNAQALFGNGVTIE